VNFIFLFLPFNREISYSLTTKLRRFKSFQPLNLEQEMYCWRITHPSAVSHPFDPPFLFSQTSWSWTNLSHSRTTASDHDERYPFPGQRNRGSTPRTLSPLTDSPRAHQDIVGLTILMSRRKVVDALTLDDAERCVPWHDYGSMAMWEAWMLPGRTS
jgi:hypothetical protein